MINQYSEVLDALDAKRRKLVRKWSQEEDTHMVALVMEHGTKQWGLIGSKLKDRTGKQCRERCAKRRQPRSPLSGVKVTDAASCNLTFCDLVDRRVCVCVLSKAVFRLVCARCL